MYQNVVIWICEAQALYCGIDNKGSSEMTVDKDTGSKLNENRQTIVKGPES